MRGEGQVCGVDDGWDGCDVWVLDVPALMFIRCKSF
jgi:hypothetical protein